MSRDMLTFKIAQILPGNLCRAGIPLISIEFGELSCFLLWRQECCSIREVYDEEVAWNGEGTGNSTFHLDLC